ncbi:MAG: glycosyltransferase [Bacteroidales bacterium]|nr:glycosyltransferase [Bacteroidales bacterium]
MNSVLIITYYWPPGAGAGVQRWLKFSKYLPDYGWKSLILTVDPLYAQYPATDESLLKDVLEKSKVFKTPAINYFRLASKDNSRIPTAGFANQGKKGPVQWLMRFIRGNFFIPDPRRGWNRFAFKKACEIISNENVTRIITSGPPHSTHLIGLKLKKKFPDILWIADFRDPWTDIYYYREFYHTFAARLLDRHYEKTVLVNADKIITVGQTLKKILSSKASGINDKIFVVANGYDEEDFKGIQPVEPDIFTITYTGTLSQAYPLTGFAEAVRKLTDSGMAVRLRFVGVVSPEQKKLLLSYVPENIVEFIPYASHPEAIKYMVSSSALLLIIPDHESNKSIVTGKLFEYLASGRPVILIGPKDGDAAEIIEKTDGGSIPGYDANDIEKAILQIIKNKLCPVKEKTILYSRKKLAGEIANILNKMS